VRRIAPLIAEAHRTINARGVNFVPARRCTATNECRAAHIGDVFDLPVGKALGNVDDHALGVTVRKNVSAGVDQDRVASFVLPVAIVAMLSSDASNRRRYAPSRKYAQSVCQYLIYSPRSNLRKKNCSRKPTAPIITMNA